jgi:hypothetical protein
MRFLKQLAFYLGMVLGLATVASVGTMALTYLFTGKFASVEMAEGKPKVTLMTADQVVAMVREQVHKAQAAQKAGGGEDDGEA